MALYTAEDDRYRAGTVKNKKFVPGSLVADKDVPVKTKDVLKQAAPGTIVDDLGDVFNPETDTDDSTDEDLKVDQSKAKLTDAQKKKIADEKKKQAELDDGEDPDEEEIIDPTAVATEQDDAGMGWKRVKGKTVSVFSDKPHETVKSIAGYMVPCTHKELEEKTDQDFLKALRKLKKI